MVLRRIYRVVSRSLEKRRPRRSPKKLRRPKRHQADKPPADGRCLLLELPTEVRLRILEYTLCDNEPIQARCNIETNSSYEASYYDYNHKVKYDEWPQGKPCLDVLSTCRRLYQEGADIFYEKNTFCITISDPGYGAYGNVDMLGIGDPQTVFSTHSRFKKCPNLKFHLFLGRTVNCTTLGYGTNKDSIDEAIEQVYQNWQGRGRMEIEVSQKGRQWVDHQIGGPALLHKFGLFRCNSVWFRGVPFSIAYRLTQLMESKQPVIDMQQAFRDISTFLDGTYIRDDLHETTYGDAYVEAERFAALYDVENFMLLRREVIEAALQKMKASFDRVQSRGLEVKGEALPLRVAGESTAQRQLMAMLEYM